MNISVQFIYNSIKNNTTDENQPLEWHFLNVGYVYDI